jgi:hypothetical protein
MNQTLTECTSTAAAITEILLGGDVLLNLTPRTLNVVRGTRFLSVVGEKLVPGEQQCSIAWHKQLAHDLPTLIAADVSRIVVVCDSSSADPGPALTAIAAAGIPHLLCTLDDASAEDGFMDEADAEAVAERLRQLGYL